MVRDKGMEDDELFENMATAPESPRSSQLRKGRFRFGWWARVPLNSGDKQGKADQDDPSQALYRRWHWSPVMQWFDRGARAD